MRFSNQKLVIIGGSAGIGLATARQALAEGAEVILGGRNAGRLQQATGQLGAAARGLMVDTADRASLQAFFAEVGSFDHLFISAADYQVVPFASDDAAAIASPFTSKFWGQYWAVRAALPYIAPGGSITLTSGAAGARPIKGAPAYAACNSAIEGLGRALAVELAPVRVNVVSPGTIDGHLWQSRPAEIRDAAFAHYRQLALSGRPGKEAEVADAVLFLAGNGFINGSVLFADGGYVLR